MYGAIEMNKLLLLYYITLKSILQKQDLILTIVLYVNKNENLEKNLEKTREEYQESTNVQTDNKNNCMGSKNNPRDLTRVNEGDFRQNGTLFAFHPVIVIFVILSIKCVLHLFLWMFSFKIHTLTCVSSKIRNFIANAKHKS